MVALSVDRLRELLSYDLETGHFRWLVSRQGTGGKGSIAGNTSVYGYREIRVDYVLHKAHRLAWLYVHGALPVNEIDHIDGNKANNRLSNLRIANRSQNTANRRTPRADNQLGVHGVSRSRNGFTARVMKDSVLYRLGTYDTVELASIAYRNKHAELYGEFSPFWGEAA